MSSAQHTPGPWMVTNPNYGSGLCIESTMGSVVAHTAVYSNPRFPVSSRISSESAEANARLIASAPELLAALKEADYRLSFHFGFTATTGHWGNILRSDLRAVIAKAEGGK